MKKDSLIRFLSLRTFLVYALALLLLGGLWTVDRYLSFEAAAKQQRAEYLEQQRKHLMDVVHLTLDYIDYKRSQTEERTRTQLRQQVEKAHALAAHLYESFHDRLSDEDMKAVIREALRPLRFNDGRGYFFAFDGSGIEQLFADRPEFEGQSMLEMRTSDGTYVVRDMLNLIKIKGAGFIDYTWTKPGSDDGTHRKIAYVKRFAPLDWVIGTGEYPEDVESDIRREVLDRIEKISFDRDNYIFVATWEGLSLSFPAKGRNMIEVTDANGVKIVQELIKLAKRGGGFLTYVVPKFDTHRSAPKLSYVAGVPEWQWYIGAGDFIDAIETTIAEQRAQVRERIIGDVAVLAVALALVLGLSLFAATQVQRRSQRSYEAFVRFFEQAEREAIPIDVEAIDFKEFRRIAQAANTMIETRRRMEYDRYLSQYALDHISDGLLRIDTDGHVRDANKAMSVLLGMAVDALSGRSYADLDCTLPDDGWGPLLLKLRSAESLRLETEMCTADDRRQEVEVVLTLLAYQGSEVIYALVRDISERRRNERFLAARSEELERSNRELEQFAYAVSHDLQEPLRLIRSFLQLIVKRLDAKIDNEEREFIDYTVDAANRMSELITGLLDYSRVQTRGGEFSDMDGGLAVENALINLRQAIEEVDARVDVHPLPPAMRGDKTQVERVFQNLISNALKYRSPDRRPEVRIRCDERPDAWEFSVTDNGIGIEEKFFDRIFVIFQRLHRADEIPGTGIGLAICKRIVERHGGTIRVESTPGQGSVFRFTIPKAPETPSRAGVPAPPGIGD